VSAHDIEGTKARALGGDGGQRVQEVAGRAGKPVETRHHHQHVALWPELADDAAQLGAVGLRAACCLAVDFGTTFGAELLELSVERLPIGEINEEIESAPNDLSLRKSKKNTDEAHQLVPRRRPET
jgi:hypothetical protein